MTNVLFDKKGRRKPIYNPTVKEQFIEYKGVSYKAKLFALFRKSYSIEEKLNKDLYKFSLEEIENLFSVLNLVNVVNTYNAINYYLRYCVEQGKIQNNVLVTVSPHHFEDFTNNKRLRFSEETLNKYISQLYNVQDRLLLRLLFEGVYGENGSELLNLKKSDFHKETNILELNCDINGQRKLKISNECMYLLEESMKNNVRYFNNGVVETNNGILYEPYCNNEYIIRNIKKKAKDETKRAERKLISNRFLDMEIT
ncbi:hypothetical protein ACIFOT_22275 [Neobacillus sp. NRS-1170]|uniref:phage lytic cycle repressor MrpR family protein n=1 Tax=Neobacillus sp. NRS-1170 TaxID=3233898 RepID=UPI003D294361